MLVGFGVDIELGVDVAFEAEGDERASGGAVARAVAVGTTLGESVAVGIVDGVELADGGEGDAPFDVPVTSKGANDETVVTEDAGPALQASSPITEASKHVTRKYGRP